MTAEILNETTSQAAGTDGATPGTLRSPRRITVTVPHRAYRSLLEHSDREGRSLSNLAAFLLEQALRAQGD